jgi:hypothetical protein
MARESPTAPTVHLERRSEDRPLLEKLMGDHAMTVHLGRPESL